MTNIHNPQELLAFDHNLSITKSSSSAAIFMTIAGIAITIIGTQINASEAVNYILGVTGFIIAIVGSGDLFSVKNAIIHTTSREPMSRTKLFFHRNDEHDIHHLLENGDIDTLIDRSIETGPIQVIIYSTTSKHYYIAQIFKFVPFEYFPHSTPITFYKA